MLPVFATNGGQYGLESPVEAIPNSEDFSFIAFVCLKYVIPSFGNRYALGWGYQWGEGVAVLWRFARNPEDVFNFPANKLFAYTK